MNASLLAHFRKQPHLQIARIAAGRDVAIAAAYEPGGAHPVWVAKTAASSQVRCRLKREHDALCYLAQAAGALQVPRVLLWEENERECIFVRTGLPGEADSVAISVESAVEVLDRYYRRPLDWLGRFQKLVAPPRALRWRDLAAEARAWLRRQNHAGMGRLADWIEQASQNVEGTAVAVHGDFFPRNILLGDQLRVVDWDQFGVGFPTHDLLYLFVGSDLHRHGRLIPMDQIALAVAFSALPIAGYFQRAATALGVPAEAMPLNFYCYLAHLLEASQGGIEEPTWLRLLDKLDQANFPPPGTVLAA